MDIKTPFLNFRDRFIESRLKPINDSEYARWSADLDAERAQLRRRFSVSEYEREDLSWYRDSVIEHFTFMYDLSFYDPKAGYKIDAFLDQGEAEFGGYDIILLWQAYPRIGCDDRNQFDFYRDMPGGLQGIRKLVDRCHERGVKAFIDYNPWDNGTRREGKPDHVALAEIVATIDADGIFLDTMSASSAELRGALDAVKPGVVFETEGSPSFEAAEYVTGSWGSFNPAMGNKFLWHREFPFIADTHLTMRWLEPRHSARIVERHTHHRTDEIYPAFFNGAGAVVWENVFGWWNPWSSQDRLAVRKLASLLRNHAKAFQSGEWQPLVPTLNEHVMANEWPAGDETVWTFINLRHETASQELLALPVRDNARYFDAWNGYREITVRTTEETTYVPLTIGPRSVGCVVSSMVGKKSAYVLTVDSGSQEFPVTSLNDNRPLTVNPTVPHQGPVLPEEMVDIPAGSFKWHLEHRQREGACYDDLSFCWANDHPDRVVEMKRYLMDRYPVTNREYKRFLDATDHEPAERANYLKHWIDGGIPSGKDDHPVVYIDLTDARKYAEWAGKRLPTEEEWQYAAQGTDGRFWPWGNEDPLTESAASRGDTETGPTLCNSDTGGTTPVDAFATSASPFGVCDMAGNVWEWTESERNDGHTRYAVLKGGSFYLAKGSRWYFDGGAQRCTAHAKFLLMWPGLDRCATVGFRCVKDVG